MLLALILMLIWVLCMFVTVMVHELGHVITGRIFGVPGNITLSGLAGNAIGGYEVLAEATNRYMTTSARISPFALLSGLPNMPAHYVSRYAHATGPMRSARLPTRRQEGGWIVRAGRPAGARLAD